MDTNQTGQLTAGTRGHLMVFGAAALWGTTGVFGRALQAAGMDSVEMAFWRVFWAFAVSGAVLAVAAPHRFRVSRTDLLTMFFFSVITVPVFELAYFTSISLNPIGLAAVLLYTAPVFVAVLAIPVLGEVPSRSQAAALLLALTGCFLVVAPGGSPGTGLSAKGILSGLASGLSYAVISLLGKKFVLKVHPWTLTFYSMAFGTLVMLPMVFRRLEYSGKYSPETWAIGLGVGVIPTLLSYGLFFGGLRLIGATAASITATVEPVVAYGLGYVLFGEMMTRGQLLGALLVLGAVIRLNLGAPVINSTEQRRGPLDEHTTRQ